jgi:hypothetical protein
VVMVCSALWMTLQMVNFWRNGRRRDGHPRHHRWQVAGGGARAAFGGEERGGEDGEAELKAEQGDVEVSGKSRTPRNSIAKFHV